MTPPFDRSEEERIFAAAAEKLPWFADLFVQKAPAATIETLAQATPGDVETSVSNYELTKRETAVLIQLAQGKTNKEIANALNVSVHTIISHRKNITHKTGIKSVAGLTVYAMLNNLIDESALL